MHLFPKFPHKVTLCMGLFTPQTKLPTGLPDRAQTTQADCAHARGDCRVKQT